MRKMESEKMLERTFSAEIDKLGGWSIKLLSQLVRGLPDRLVLCSRGVVFFVEFKTSGKLPTRMQDYIHSRLRALGFSVYVVDSRASRDALIAKYRDDATA